MKHLLFLITSLLVNSTVGALLSTALGLSPVEGAVAANVTAAAFSFLPSENSVLRAGVFTEIWTGELVKRLRGMLSGSWLDGITDNSSIVENDVIHLVDVGVDPEVIINQTTYPIPIQALNDQDIAVKLDKFQTEVTPITDDELYASSYDKIARVRDAHAEAINVAKCVKAAHSFCPQKHTATTPVLSCSGEEDAASGRHRMTVLDVIAMKAAMDKLGVPADNRRLVLSADHVNDLLMTEQKFREQYGIDSQTGRIARLYGFDIYEFSETPVYDASGEKKAVGATVGSGESRCSFAFYVPRVFKATGRTKMYYSEAANDPQYQRNLVNFRHMFHCMPKQSDAFVAIR